MDPRNNPLGELNRFLYTQCYDQLCAGVSAALGRPLTAVLHQSQYGIKVDGADVYYCFTAWAEYSEEAIDLVDIICRFAFDGIGYDLAVTDVLHKESDPHHGTPNPCVNTDQHLIPRLYPDELREKEADRFLCRYCPEALTEPMPVPIRAIMEQKMGLNVVMDIQLPGDSFGQTLFSDDNVPVMEELGTDIKIIPYRRGTVLIDWDKAFFNGVNSINFTLAHEAYHWFAHRAYVGFHRLIGKQDDVSYNGTSKYSASDILEIQANAMASRILMPKEMFLKKYRELSGEDLNTTIAALADFFCVSFRAAAIRLSQLGIHVPSARSKVQKIYNEAAAELYFSNDDFRQLVDDELVVYVGDGYVYNDPRFVKTVWEEVPKHGQEGMSPYRLTEYAMAHPEEAYVTFTMEHKRIAGTDTVLLRESDERLRAPVEYIRQNCKRETREMECHAERFEKLFLLEQGKHPTYCQLAKGMIDYRYGRMEKFDSNSENGMVWDPAQEMPEVHAVYFLPDRKNKLSAELEAHPERSDELQQAIEEEEELEQEIDQRFQDNFAPRERNADGTIEKASSPRELFCADTIQPRTYYNKIMKGEAGAPEPRLLMSLCVGMCLGIQASRALFTSAGRMLTWSRTDMAYRYILHHLRGRYIEDVNLFLDMLGLPLLGANQHSGEKENRRAGT